MDSFLQLLLQVSHAFLYDFLADFLYSGLLGLATLVGAASAGFVLAQSPERRPSRLLALQLLVAAVWSGCELAASVAADPLEARLWLRLAAPAWLAIGPVLGHLVFVTLAEAAPLSFRPWRKLQGWTTAFGYASSAWLATTCWTGAWVIGPLTPRAWGWSFVPGPGLFVAHGVALAIVMVSCFVIRRSTADASRAATLQRPWLWLAIACPTVAILTTDVVLPAVSIPVPRLGAASMALAGAIICWTVLHYGLSLMTSPRFGDQMLETLDDGVALVNVDGTVRRANRSLARLSGHPVASLRGMRIRELLGRDLHDPAEADLLRGELLTSSSSRIPVSISIRVLRERQQNEVGLVVVLRDLREIEEMRRISLTNARLAAVGELAAGIAHEINNPIAFVGTNLRLLRDHWEKLASGARGALSAADREQLSIEGRELLTESIEGVERAAEIVRGVKNFTHGGSAERSPARLADLIQDCLRMLRPQLSPGVRFVLEFGDLPDVVCAPQELKQVILNLAINALHAVGRTGEIRIETRREGDLAVISVADDGCGISSDVIDRIFDPFFTTKSVGEGTGLGLGIAHQVVTRHGGVITVSSEPGLGATFRVHLPLDASAASSSTGSCQNIP